MRTVWLLWRILGFVALSYFAYRLFERAIAQGSPIAMAGTLLFAAAAFILAAIILSPDLAKVVSRPLTSFIDSIYLPGGREKKPPLDYRKAELYIRRSQFEKAEEVLADIIRHYPEELRAYLAMAEVCLELEDKKAAEVVLAKAHKKLHHDATALEAIKRAREKVLESGQPEPA